MLAILNKEDASPQINTEIPCHHNEKYLKKYSNNPTDAQNIRPAPLLPQTIPNYLFFKQLVFLSQNLIVEVPSCNYKRVRKTERFILVNGSTHSAQVLLGILKPPKRSDQSL